MNVDQVHEINMLQVPCNVIKETGPTSNTLGPIRVDLEIWGLWHLICYDHISCSVGKTSLYFVQMFFKHPNVNVGTLFFPYFYRLKIVLDGTLK